MHVEIHSDSLVRVRVMSLWGEHKYTRKLGVTIEGTDAGDDIAVEDLECLTSDNDFAPYETRTTGGKVVVYDCVELTDVLERQSQQLDKLDG